MLKHVASFALPLTPVIIAKMDFSGAQLFVWLGVLTFLVVLFNALAQAWRTLSGGLKENPPPPDTYETRELSAERHAAIDREIAEIKVTATTNRAEMRSSLAGIQRRINEVLTAVSELRGEVRAGKHHE